MKTNEILFFLGLFIVLMGVSLVLQNFNVGVVGRNYVNAAPGGGMGGGSTETTCTAYTTQAYCENDINCDWCQNMCVTSGTCQSIIRANSCDMDDTCEVNGRVMSNGNLWLTSTTGHAKIEGDLTLAKIGQTGGVLFETNDLGSLTITPGSEAAKLVADLTLTHLGSPSGVILKTVYDQLVIAASLSRFQGQVAINSMVSNITENAYVCVNEKGILFRSITPCR